MIKKNIFVLSILLFPVLLTAAGVKIVKVKGEVQIRKGLDEQWQSAKNGMVLEDIDTILSLDGEVVMQLAEDITFVLGPKAMLDIADLRNISKEDLFLLLMSGKVKKIDTGGNRQGIKVSNVTVVHAESKLPKGTGQIKDDTEQRFIFALNGAKALFEQYYYTNAVAKLNQILNRFPDKDDCGEVYYYLGRSFERLSETGQALDAYNESLKRITPDCKVRYKPELESAVKRLQEAKQPR